MTAVAGIPAPHLLVGALCQGLALSLAVREPGLWLPAMATLLAVLALLSGKRRALVLALGTLLAGWWLGTLRL